MALRSHSLAFTGLSVSANGQILLIFIRLLKDMAYVLIFFPLSFFFSFFFLEPLNLSCCNMKEFQAQCCV